ncbi:LysR family transcriptional regulator [Actinomycetospora endophytica]|uniref:LysR family transcriptional regulator n=1 Tax=Actinomycetospora endophytica TaxID=2291215 RepID=A0ABS8P942_9PSEU|nr:LysR family transcriptional regulator [Actinomycetospora endophytica]MCD2194790.1 LysR family transcriptional regulator [Actinomycetospora endophytica]
MALPRRVADLAVYEMALSVAALGSMGRAATEHGVSQAAVSARVRALEEALGLTLFERSPQGTRLTPAGSLVADWARGAVDAAWAMEEGVAALQAEHTGRLRVAASLTVAEYLLPRWLVALRTELPETSVSLTTRNSTEVADDVRTGAADLGFVEGPEIGDDLDSQVMGHDELVLVMAPTHRWARRRAVIPAQLAATPLVTRETGSGTREFLERALETAGAGPTAAPVLELASTTAIKAAVADGVAPAVLSSLAVAGELEAGTLVTLPVRGVALGRRLTAIWRRGRAPDGAAAALLARARAAHEHRTRPARATWRTGAGHNLSL